MNLEHINNLIQEEKDRHQRALNKIESDKCSENERYQRQMEYLNRQKQTAKALNTNEAYSEIKLLLEKFNEVLKDTGII